MKLRKLVLFRPSGLGELFEFHGARCNAYSMGRTMTAKASEEENAMPDAQVISAAKDIQDLVTTSAYNYLSGFTYDDVRRQRPVMTYCCEYAHGYWDGFQKGSKVTVKWGVKLSR